jgi:glycosyltransferase involved in cell wall biosynthesis
MSGVSFVVICYNHARYAGPVTRALTAQRGIDDAEYIFIDDGSTDGTAEALAAATQGWPDTTIHRQENQGPSKALNQGLARATRPLIKLVGGDDVLHPDAAARLRAAMDRHAAVYGFGALHGFDPARGDDDAYWRSLFDPIDDAGETAIDDPLAFMARGMSFNPSCVLARTAEAKAAGGSDERVFVEDYSLSLRMALRGRFVQLHAPVAFAPEGDALRLGAHGAQTLHDVNLALAGLMADHPGLPGRYRRLMARRALTRAWHWARRHGRRTALSRDFLLFALAQLRLLPARPGHVFDSCRAFTATDTIRRPGGE